MSKKNEVRIPIKVDGKEILLTKKQIDKMNASLDKTGTSAHSADRRLKGAARTSSSGTKNFSKMAQGITGGLVPAYATLAANIFAISAAFRFLKDAGDLRILQQGQLEYSQRTGQSLSILTRQLQAATQGQLAYAEAAQAVAIGTAAGLSAKQINDLGRVAKNASLALGRDLTDSFNRLIRGAVKAEPELLDELGIILRLDTAARKYALTLDKTKEQLTIFEKSQAVVNEILDQGEDKFGGITVQVNELQKLAKAFDDLVNSMKRTIGPIAEFTASALGQNTLATAGAGALLGTGVARAIIPQRQKIDYKSAADVAAKNLGSIYSGKRDLGNLTSGGIKGLERDIKNAYSNNRSTVINFEKMRREEALQSLNVIKVATLEESAARTTGFRKFMFDTKLAYHSYLVETNKGMAITKAFGYAAARVGTVLLRVTGYFGIALSVIGILKQLFDKSTEAEKQFKSQQKEFSTLMQRNAEDLEKMTNNLKEQNNIFSSMIQNAKVLSNIDFSGISKVFDQGLTKKISAREDMTGFFGKIGNVINRYVENPIARFFGYANFSTMSDEQQSGIEGLIRVLKAEQSVLIEGTDAYDEYTKKIQIYEKAILMSGEGTLEGSEHMKVFTDSLKDLEEKGTLAQRSMKGITSTTKMLTGASQDFEKALNTFKTAQTPFTRLSSNIKQTGELLRDLGKEYSKVMAKINAKDGAKFFDSATKNLVDIMVGKDFEFDLGGEFGKSSLTGMDSYIEEQSKLIRDAERFAKGEGITTGQYGAEYFDGKIVSDVRKANELIAKMTPATIVTETGKEIVPELTEEEKSKIIAAAQKNAATYASAASTAVGKALLKRYEEVNKLEKKLILDKTRAQTNFTLLALGSTKLQTKELQKQLKLAQTQAELQKSRDTIDLMQNQFKLEVSDAQVVAEQANLRRLEAMEISLQKQLDYAYQIAQVTKNSFESGLSSGIDSLITNKEGSLTDALKTLGRGVLESISKELSDQMAKGVSDFIFGKKELTVYESGAEIIKRAHIEGIKEGFGMNAGDVSSAGGTVEMSRMQKAFDIGKNLFSFIPGLAKGGITPEYAKGGVTPVYAATGGVFSGSKQGYPAIMHGNEAVVPLPDGKSIPVSGGMGGTVNVSVNMATGETSSTSNAEDMYQMGTAIAQAVENELEKQQRPGGMLAPY